MIKKTTLPVISNTRIPATIITGFLGAGKTTLIRHLLAHANGKRIAIIVNEFGSLGIDGELLTNCGIEGCTEDSVIELANGCLCCTVADEFLPAMQALLDGLCRLSISLSKHQDWPSRSLY